MAGFGGASLFMLERSAVGNYHRNSGRLVTLKLDGSVVPLPVKIKNTPASVYQVPQSAPLKHGEDLYTQYCGFCHGMFGSKSLLPDLTKMRPEIEAIFKQIVLDGVFQDKGMASFADVLNEKDVELIREYLRYQGK